MTCYMMADLFTVVGMAGAGGDRLQHTLGWAMKPLTMTDLLIVVSMEGKVPTDHGIQHHAQAPDIHRRPVVLLAPDNLWGGITGAATMHLHEHRQLGYGCIRRARQAQEPLRLQSTSPALVVHDRQQ